MADRSIRSTEGIASQCEAKCIKTIATYQLYCLVASAGAASIMSNASDTCGSKAFSSLDKWFQLEWPELWRECHIAKRITTDRTECDVMWRWQDKTIRCRYDNATVVAIPITRMLHNGFLLSSTSHSYHSKIAGMCSTMPHLSGNHNLVLVA